MVLAKQLQQRNLQVWTN